MGTQYVPNPAGATEGYVLTVLPNESLAYLPAPSSDPGTSNWWDELTQRVVWANSNKEWGTVPLTSPTPVQDAISDMGGRNIGGTVVLPYGVVNEEGPIDEYGFKRIIGQGLSEGRFLSNDRHGTTLNITGGGDGFLHDTTDDADFSLLHDFTLRAHDRSDGRAAIRYGGLFTGDGGTTAHAQQAHLGRLRFTEWTNTTANDDPGIISAVGTHTFSSLWHLLEFSNTSGPAIYAAGNTSTTAGMFYTNQCYWIGHGPRDDSTVLLIDDRVDMTFGHISCGSSTWKILEGNMNDFGYLKIGSYIFEPNGNFGTNRSEVFQLNGPGFTEIGPGVVYLSSVDSVFNLGSGNGNKNLTRPRTWDTTINNAIVQITSTPTEPSWYWGPASEIQDDPAAGTGLVRSMATAGGANG